MAKTCAAQQMGPDAMLLVAIIAHQEDAVRYRGPVSFFSDQLLPILGFSKWDRLDRARKAAIAADWLAYCNGGHRKPGWYYATVPAGLENVDDSPLDESGEIFNPSFDTPFRGSTGGTSGGQQGEQNGHSHCFDTPFRGSTGGASGGQQGDPPTLALSLTLKDKPLPSVSSSSKKKKRNGAANQGLDFAELEIPDSLRTPEFEAAWEAWLCHRGEIKPAWTMTAAETCLKRLARLDVAAAVEAVENSTAAGWKSIHPSKDRPGTDRSPTDPLSTLTSQTLRDTSALLKLLPQISSSRACTIPDTEAGRLEFVAAAEVAIAEGDSPVAMFRSLLKSDKRGINLQHEEAARRRLLEFRRAQNGHKSSAVTAALNRATDATRAAALPMGAEDR